MQNAVLGPYEQHLLQGDPFQPLNSALTQVIKEADSLILILTFQIRCRPHSRHTVCSVIEDTLSLQVHNQFMIGYLKYIYFKNICVDDKKHRIAGLKNYMRGYYKQMQ